MLIGLLKAILDTIMSQPAQWHWGDVNEEPAAADGPSSR
jgi:hypothetical protein